MKISEMNSNQLQVYRLVVEECNNFFGGYENQLQDSEEGSEYYNQAVKALTAPQEEICKDIECWVRSSRVWEYVDHLHFVSLDWMRERIRKRVAKMQAETRNDFPEIFND